MKKTAAFITALIIGAAHITAFAGTVIPDHIGTDMSGIETGTSELNGAVKSYSDFFKSSGDRYGVDPNLLAAICMQESSGRNLSYRDDGTEYPAWGIMQIEYTNEKAFAAFGKSVSGAEWTLGDRLDPEKSVAFAAHLISKALIHYDCDYMKTLQSYNFGQTVLDKITDAAGEGWLGERKNAKNYVDNWPYETYGDAEYIEHVMRYYHNDIEYSGAKVRADGKLIDFDDQFPVIKNGRTLIPVRAVSELLGAKVEWNGAYYQAEISLDGHEIIIPLYSDISYIDGREAYLDVPAEMINDRTMVPLRFIAEALGVNVSWDGDTRTVYIKT